MALINGHRITTKATAQGAKVAVYVDGRIFGEFPADQRQVAQGAARVYVRTKLPDLTR